jgi:hypothetical protein
MGSRQRNCAPFERAIVNAPDVSELQYAQGDIGRAVQILVDHQLSWKFEWGAIECERIMREHGEGNTTMWIHPSYLRTTIHMAQEIVAYVRASKLP